MSTIVCLGGYGQFGLTTARLLAERPEVERVVVAGRSLAKAQAAAERLGPKARGEHVDVDDPTSLADAVRDATVVVSTLWEPAKRQDPIIRAAAAAGAHYIDLSGRAPSEETDRAARQAGITAVTGAGAAPGLTNLMGTSAADALDEVEGLLSVFTWPQALDAWSDLFEAYIPLPGGSQRGPEGRRLYPALTARTPDLADTWTVVRDARVVPFWLTMLGDPSGWVESVPVAEAGRIVHVHPRQDGIELPRTDGGTARARPLLTEAGGNDMPRLEGIPAQAANVSGFSEAFDALLLDAARQVREGADPVALVDTVQAALEQDLERYLLPPDRVATLPPFAAMAIGRRGGGVARSMVTLDPAAFDPANFLELTSAVQALTVRHLLDGTITERGVHRVEEVMELSPAFEREYRKLLPVLPDGTELFRRVVDEP